MTQPTEYIKLKEVNLQLIIQKIKDFFAKDGRISKAWLFGSFARRENNFESDIDLMIRFNNPEGISLFDYADITYLLSEALNIKVDLVEEGYLIPSAWETAKNDLVLIYE